MRLWNKNTLLTVTTVLFLGSKVQAENDCQYLERAIKYFNEDIAKVFKVDKCCDFNGVRCDADQNIHEIKFNNLNKTKDITSFMDRIANIKNLTYLDLANNNIEGAIPKSLCKITTLKNLNLSKNKLTGAIPYECKALQNLEQVNLEGNNNLTGYIPVFSNIRGCSYKDTGLCDVKESACKSASKICTEEDVKNTNAVNGNPEPTSNSYEGATSSRGSIYADDQGYSNGYGSPTMDTSSNAGSTDGYNNGYSYGYSGYDNYSNYGNYDTSNYYGNTGYGYGYGDWSNYGNGYDNSYYNNGYYGTGYDNGYYYGTGYDTSYYDNGYYGTGYGTGYYYSGAASIFSSYHNILITVVAVILGCVLLHF